MALLAVVKEDAFVPPFAMPRIPVILSAPIDEVAITRPLASVARIALVSEVSHVEPVLVNCVVVARVALKSPTTVEDAWETNPELNVPSPVSPSVEESVVAPVTPRVPAKEPLPPVNVPMVAALEKSDVEVAVPK